MDQWTDYFDYTRNSNASGKAHVDLLYKSSCSKQPIRSFDILENTKRGISIVT